MPETSWDLWVTEETCSSGPWIASLLAHFDAAGLSFNKITTHYGSARRIVVEAIVAGTERAVATMTEGTSATISYAPTRPPLGRLCTLTVIESARTPTGSPTALQRTLTRICEVCDAEVLRLRPVGSGASTAHEMEIAAQTRTSLHDVMLHLRSDDPTIELGLYPSGLRRGQRLVVFDVDSTLIEGEMIDELASLAGAEAQCSAITAAAMAGKVPFDRALRDRVALLGGLPASALLDVQDRLRLAPGARALTRSLRRLGFKIALVSGGFTPIVESLADELGLHHFAANHLEIDRGRLTGRVVGPIIDGEGKAQAVRDFAAGHGLALRQVVTVGDGANDAEMLQTAGLGVAYGARAVARMSADATLPAGQLIDLLCYLGISPEHFAEVRDAAEAT